MDSWKSYATKNGARPFLQRCIKVHMMFCNWYWIHFRQLVDRLDRMKRNTSGNRSNQCMLCGASFGVMGPISCAAFCHDCHRYVCQKNCGLETADGKGKAIFLCKLCSETREIWKKSGAWFYRGIPEHVKVPARPRSAEAPGSPTERRRLDGSMIRSMVLSTSRAIRSESLSQSFGESFDSNRPRPVSLTDSRPVAQQSPSPPMKASENLSNALSRTSLNENALPWQSSEKVSPRQDSSYESSPDNDIGKKWSFGIDLLTLACTKRLAVNLPAMDSNGFSDPYVKLHLLPQATKLRTRTMPKTLNPCWNEQLIYHGVSLDDMKRKTLRLTVLDEDRIGSDFLGETRVPLKRVTPGKEKYFNVYLEKQMPVRFLFAKCNPFNVILNAGRKRENFAQFVLQYEIVGPGPPFLRLLKSETNKVRQAKTEVKKRTLNPVFNQLFRFNLPYEDMAGVTLCVQVWDKDVGKHDDFIGSLELGTTTRGECMKHWIECIQNPNKIVKRWHRLTV
ncbi:C2 and FYVE 2 domain containing protein [Trichuris trichiura]|uniref:C2 and FYVE 2 domain containing protein n=1 Tax=Trichuris trichiura TaxID=36087 RepID=A0A077Z6A1_TRITR|nr:C2 and FYVE 2 domain containing protein [Trichuris trichiura]